MTDDPRMFGDSPLLIRFSRRQTLEEAQKVYEFTSNTSYNAITKESLEALGVGEVIELVVQGKRLV